MSSISTRYARPRYHYDNHKPAAETPAPADWMDIFDDSLDLIGLDARGERQTLVAALGGLGVPSVDAALADVGGLEAVGDIELFPDEFDDPDEEDADDFDEDGLDDDDIDLDDADEDEDEEEEEDDEFDDDYDLDEDDLDADGDDEEDEGDEGPDAGGGDLDEGFAE